MAAAAIIGQANNIAGTRSSDRSDLRSKRGELASFASFTSFAGEAESVAPPVVDCGTVLDDEQEARLRAAPIVLAV